MFLQALLDQQGLTLEGMIASAFNEMSVQPDATPEWDDGRRIDMDAFDQLPKPVRDHINEYGHFYPIEDILYEHRNEHGSDHELTLVWLLECEDLQRDLEAQGIC